MVVFKLMTIIRKLKSFILIEGIEGVEEVKYGVNRFIYSTNISSYYLRLLSQAKKRGVTFL